MISSVYIYARGRRRGRDVGVFPFFSLSLKEVRVVWPFAVWTATGREGALGWDEYNTSGNRN